MSDMTGRFARQVSHRIGEAVPTAAALRATPTEYRVNGQLFYCEENATLYRFDSASTRAYAGVEAPTVGAGKFVPVASPTADLVLGGFLVVAGPRLAVFAPHNITAVAETVLAFAGDPRAWSITTAPTRTDVEVYPMLSAAASTSSLGAPGFAYDGTPFGSRMRVLSVTPTVEDPDSAVFVLEVWLTDSAGDPIDPSTVLGALQGVLLTAHLGAPANIIIAAAP